MEMAWERGEDGPCRGTSSLPRAISLTFDVLWGLAGNIDEFKTVHALL
jgi:hypothetical protein